MKRIARFFANRAGFEIRRSTELPSPVPGIRHAVVFPEATYCPWLADNEFQQLFESIRHNTLVDRYRCFELWELVRQSAKLPAGDLIEVGVWRGGTGALIAKKCELLGLRNTIYLCDTFKGVVKAGTLDAGYVGGEHANTSKTIVVELLRSLNLSQPCILEGIFPDESSHLLDGRQFRFCHIDVDVYQSAKDIVDWIWPRLVRGGIIVYDDYGFPGCTGITRFVNEERAKEDRIVLHNLNGHAIVIKVDNTPAGA